MLKTYCGLAVSLGLLVVVACGGESEEDPKATGGSGGQSTQGGQVSAGQGGRTNTGGNTASGGSTASGGTRAATGGTRSSGGATSASGGRNARGGTTSSGGGEPVAGESNGGSPDGTRPLDELTEMELDDVCQEQATRIDTPEFKEQNCRVVGVLAALETPDQLSAACQSAYDECKATDEPAQLNCSDGLGDCTATVAEFNACFDAFPAWIGTLNVPACADLTLASLIPLITKGATLPDACEPLQTKCPDVLPVPSP